MRAAASSPPDGAERVRASWQGFLGRLPRLVGHALGLLGQLLRPVEKSHVGNASGTMPAWARVRWGTPC